MASHALPPPADTPTSVRKLQACVRCKLVKTETQVRRLCRPSRRRRLSSVRACVPRPQFAEAGCDNCGSEGQYSFQFKG